MSIRTTSSTAARTIWRASPRNYRRVATKNGPLVLAYGRDPYFDGWPDTLQLNYGNPRLQQAMIGELERIAGQCDGVRCDMAMLVLPEVFERTWGIRPDPFWPKAIEAVRRGHPDFLFMAEVYWDLEWTLQQQGFDYTYDKRLYDRLREHARPPRARAFLRATRTTRTSWRVFWRTTTSRGRLDICARSPRRRGGADVPLARPAFLPSRAVRGPAHAHLAASGARPDEAGGRTAFAQFYARLLAVLRRPIVREGNWSLLECRPAWHDNPTSDNFIAFCWEGSADEWLLVAVNYSPQQSQCFMRTPFPQLRGTDRPAA